AREEDRTYMGFAFQGRFYQWNALPFGLAISPWAFTKLVKVAVDMLRARGIRINAYVDDFLILGANPRECMQATIQTIEVLRSLGWFINPEKSSLRPAQCFEYLGMTIDTTGDLVQFKVPA